MREKEKLTANILFSGIGFQERGFRDSGLFDIEVLNTSEINKESVLSYAAIHCGMTNEMVDTYKNYPSREEMAQHLTEINLGYEPEKNKYFDWFKLVKRKKNDLEKYWLACKLTHNLGDITRIMDLPYADFWTVSFPCTDISVSGKMKGLNPDSGTRSSLLWDNIRLLGKAKDDNKLPKYIMFENVKNLVSKKFINNFNNLLEVLDELGFNSYWSVINGKDCGVPQSRERVFVISIRKDIDTGNYIFPKPFDTGIRLKDILENHVDEKYYLPDEKVQEFLKTSATVTRIVETPDISYCLDTNYWKGTTPEQYISKKRRQLIFENISQFIRIRKLTPRECWRLMGLTFKDCDKSTEIGVTNTHLYRQAGNGMITNCCALLAEHLYKAQYDNTHICTDERNQGNHKQSTSESNPVCGENKLNCIGMLDGTGHDIRRRVYNPEGVSPTLCGVGYGGNTEPKIVVGAAMRGRYNSEGKTEQQIEIRDDELSNAITTVQKDSLVVEKKF